ncbi:MAG: TetR family transcriptional regulator [Edaphobacter sp.]|uniref:TetR family transcriptional regulator n=1 Tax=Edaphobacter sp. TaxID=1934404 RepID=UPI0023823232|nr:TetR family transcriptional regulator [Edaphobacter sp.]MDE1176350.1 TetR family transcriptional regulator [Edaphobacter sp.]
MKLHTRKQLNPEGRLLQTCKHNARDGKKQQARSTRTYQELLGAAEIVFVRDGYEKAALADIAQTAGKTRGAVYSHFKDKEDVFVTLIEERALQHGAVIRAIIAELNQCKDATDPARQRVIHATENSNTIILLMEFQLYAVRNPHIQRRVSSVLMPGIGAWLAGGGDLMSVGRTFMEEAATVFKAITVLDALRIGVRSASLSWDQPAVGATATGLVSDIFKSFFDDNPSPTGIHPGSSSAL